MNKEWIEKGYIDEPVEASVDLKKEIRRLCREKDAVLLVNLGTPDEPTPVWLVGVHMPVLGGGLGATMQNLVLVVQNTTSPADMGAASSLVNFFRSIGGAAGVSAMGAIFAHHVTRGGSAHSGTNQLSRARSGSRRCARTRSLSRAT